MQFQIISTGRAAVMTLRRNCWLTQGEMPTNVIEACPKACCLRR